MPRASFTAQQLQHVIQTSWVTQEQSSQDGEASLKARILDKNFQQRIFDVDMATCASPTSHMSLKILLTWSLINRWDVITANLSSALLPAPIASEELVLVEPPSELEQDPGVLWKLARALYGIKTSPELWRQFLASKLEELGLKKNKVVPCIFTSAQLMVMFCQHSCRILASWNLAKLKLTIGNQVLCEHVSKLNMLALPCESKLRSEILTTGAVCVDCKLKWFG